MHKIRKDRVFRTPGTGIVKRQPALTLAQKLRPIQDRIAKRPAAGLRADKAFFDALTGD